MHPPDVVGIRGRVVAVTPTSSHTMLAQADSATEWTGGWFADGFVFRDGKLTEYYSFSERADALAWAGIDDAEASRAG